MSLISPLLFKQCSYREYIITSHDDILGDVISTVTLYSSNAQNVNNFTKWSTNDHNLCDIKYTVWINFPYITNQLTLHAVMHVLMNFTWASYSSPSKIRHNFEMGRTITLFLVLIFALRTNPLSSGMGWRTLPSNQHFLGAFVSTIGTKSFTWRLRRDGTHFALSCSCSKYSFIQRIQKTSARYWTWRHLLLA